MEKRAQNNMNTASSRRMVVVKTSKEPEMEKRYRHAFDVLQRHSAGHSW